MDNILCAAGRHVITNLIAALEQVALETGNGVTVHYNRSFTSLSVRSAEGTTLAQLTVDLVENARVELSTYSCSTLARVEALDTVLPHLVAAARQLQSVV